MGAVASMTTTMLLRISLKGRSCPRQSPPYHPRTNRLTPRAPYLTTIFSVQLFLRPSRSLSSLPNLMSKWKLEKFLRMIKRRKRRQLLPRNYVKRFLKLSRKEPISPLVPYPRHSPWPPNHPRLMKSTSNSQMILKITDR